LLVHLPSPVIRLHRAITLGQVYGPGLPWSWSTRTPSSLGRYHLYHATRPELLRQLDRPAQGRLASQQALRLTANPTEPALLEQRPT